jgi:hypothetical protein
LIVCPQDEIIRRTLNIYRLTPDVPMPTDDEVIYCTTDTTCEQLELFWKRCIFGDGSTGKKIYCLMNVQDLLYDQAVNAEICFERLLTSDKARSDFTLCILCSIEKEDKSVFATAFTRNKKNVPLERDLDTCLRDYLTSHFKSATALDSVDQDGLSVRVVTSEQPAVGKSLHIRRQIEKARNQVSTKIPDFCISIKKQSLPLEVVFKKLQRFDELGSLEFERGEVLPRILHIDIAYEVWYHVDYFLFNLLCLGKCTVFLIKYEGSESSIIFL